MHEHAFSPTGIETCVLETKRLGIADLKFCRQIEAPRTTTCFEYHGFAYVLGAGLVNSQARPNGNTTGVSILATELDGKRQELLIEAIPGQGRWPPLLMPIGHQP
jgi:hypothetical protein